MHNKQKFLLKFIAECNKRSIKSKTHIMKLLFLLKKEYNIDNKISFYSFYPYKYGPYSSTVNYDINQLQKAGLLTENLNLTKEASPYIQKEFEEINEVLNRYDNKIVEYVYQTYPEFTSKSELKEKKAISKNDFISTIGYEGEDIDSFMNKLIQNNITMLIDVRYNPFSMKLAFTQKSLALYLEKVGIHYIHFQSLGIIGEKRKSLETDESYKKLFEDYENNINKESIKKILEFSKGYNVAIMCFEANKNKCHRSIIAKFIENNNIRVVHL